MLGFLRGEHLFKIVSTIEKKEEGGANGLAMDYRQFFFVYEWSDSAI